MQKAQPIDGQEDILNDDNHEDLEGISKNLISLYVDGDLISVLLDLRFRIILKRKRKRTRKEEVNCVFVEEKEGVSLVLFKGKNLGVILRNDIEVLIGAGIVL